MYIAHDLLSKRTHLNHRAAALAIAAVLIAAIGTGCGGGDDLSSGAANPPKAASNTDSAGSLAPVKKIKFVRQANALCGRKVKEGLEAITGEVAKKAEPGNRQSARQVQAETVHTAFLPQIDALIDELAELEVPAGDEEAIEAIIDAMRSGFDQSMETEYTGTSIASFGEEFRESARLARRYGIAGCAIG